MHVMSSVLNDVSLGYLYQLFGNLKNSCFHVVWENWAWLRISGRRYSVPVIFSSIAHTITKFRSIPRQCGSNSADEFHLPLSFVKLVNVVFSQLKEGYSSSKVILQKSSSCSPFKDGIKNKVKTYIDGNLMTFFEILISPEIAKKERNIRL